jgi:DNA-binding response OmpR family regulator
MSKSVLVVEDDQFLAETIRLAIEDNGGTVRMAGDGEAAIEEIEKQRPDLLLLDIIMPKKDGLAVLQYLHAKKYDFPVVILSNLSGDMDPQYYFSLGVREYLVKSDMDESDLWPRIQKYLK